MSANQSPRLQKNELTRLQKLVNNYSNNLLNSIEKKSFTEENIKNMLLTNGRILVLLNNITSNMTPRSEVNEMKQQINSVSISLNQLINHYKNHKHTYGNQQQEETNGPIYN